MMLQMTDERIMVAAFHDPELCVTEVDVFPAGQEHRVVSLSLGEVRDLRRRLAEAERILACHELCASQVSVTVH